MKDAQVALLIREGEGLAVEFKERYSSRIDQDIVAFANARGGSILLGVRDDGTVNGETLTNDLKAKINDLARNCKPRISVQLSQSDKVVVVEVQEGTEKPYACGDGYFRRLNGTTQKMSPDELRIMFRDNDPVPFEERKLKGFLGSVSTAKIYAFIKEAGIDIPKLSADDFLRSLKVADAGGVNHAGILFFGDAGQLQRFLPQAQISLIAFKGTTKVHIFDRRDVRDDLLMQFDAAILFIEKHLNVRSEIKGVDRKDIYEIPLEAIREAVVNALMHRDYSITGTQVSVEIFDDRVEITNPGGLPNGLPRKVFGTVSVRRNELIADLFSRLHKVERAGTGIQRMKEVLAAAGLKEPQFDTNGFFRAIFFRSPEFSIASGVEEKGWERLGEELGVRLGETEKKILHAVLNDKRATIKLLSKKLNISTTAVENNIASLKKKKLLHRVGPDRGGHWEVTLK
ncbi:MAG TPA: helix-turn-helix domain-containing protein [Elusimicrobiota bacterium]|nr:helix-turn-helix domain-containing protein [Elusimicrobiota bacterium]